MIIVKYLFKWQHPSKFFFFLVGTFCISITCRHSRCFAKSAVIRIHLLCMWEFVCLFVFVFKTCLCRTGRLWVRSFLVNHSSNSVSYRLSQEMKGKKNKKKINKKIIVWILKNVLTTQFFFHRLWKACLTARIRFRVKIIITSWHD